MTSPDGGVLATASHDARVLFPGKDPRGVFFSFTTSRQVPVDWGELEQNIRGTEKTLLLA